jgi:uncharacterized coiled-coil protein SlyX
MRQILLDPVVNIQVQKLREELDQAQSKLKSTREELEAVQFTSNSITGKKLLAKCRLLQAENEEFDTLLSDERIHRLENELSLQRELTEELKKGLVESNDLVTKLDSEVEVMQQEIFTLRRQLKTYPLLRHESIYCC